MKGKIITAVALALVVAGTVIGGFKYETTLTVAGYTADETLNVFPLLVRISAAKISGFSYDKCQADGKDLMFTSLDGKTVYPHEIDEWNSGVGQESLAWVRIPALVANHQFKMRFGDAAIASAPAYTTNGTVWKPAGYFAVFHLNETENQGTTDFLALDSSCYGFNATPKKGGSGNLAQIVSYASGVIGRARGLNNTAQWAGNGLVGCNYNNLGVGDTFAVSGWFDLAQGNGNQVFFARKSSTGDPNGWHVANGNASQIYVYGAGSSAKSFPVGVNMDTAGWCHVTVVYNGQNATVYFQGESKGTGALPAAPTENNQEFSIGNVVSVNTTTALSGWQDELRFRDAMPTEAWVKADYESQALSGYVTAAAVAENVVTDTITVTSSSAYQVGVVSPDYGTSVISAGTVTCTAPSTNIVVSETERFSYTGWKLTIIAADNTVTTTTGTGSTCSFTHVAGTSANLEWQHNRYFLIDATSMNTDAGTVTGGGFIGDGETVMLTAVPAAGKEFRRWISPAILTVDTLKNPYAFRVTGPMEIQADFCDLRYCWLNPSHGNWKDAVNWMDLDDDGTGDIPPNDGTATVILPAGKSAYTVTLSGTHAGISVKGFCLRASTVKNDSSGNAVTLSGGSVTLGAGGIEMDDTAYTLGIKFSTDVYLTASQTWMNKSYLASGNDVNNNTLTFSRKIAAPEDVVVTVSGTTPFAPNANNAAEFRGKIRTNCTTSFVKTSLFTLLEAPGLIEFYPTDEPYPAPSSFRITAETAKNPYEIKIVAPIRFDWADTTQLMKVQLQVAVNIVDNAWNYDWASPMSGAFANKTLSFGNVMTSSSQHRSHHPEKQRNYFSGDNSGLVTNGLPAICFPNGVFTVAHSHALGTANVLGVHFGGDTAGYYTGLTATNGITVNSNMTLEHKVPVLLGMLDAGEAYFNGNLTGNTDLPIFLNAPAGGKVHFTGAFTMNNDQNQPLEITGGGEVYLEGNNANVTDHGINVRSARAYLGHDNAAGTKPINLGGVVPTQIVVRVYADRTFGYINANIKQETNERLAWTTSDEMFVIDGVTLVPGDKVYYTPDMADGSVARIYKVDATAKRMEICDQDYYLPGARILVTDGVEYAGRAFMATKSATNTSKGFIPGVNDVPDPDVAVLAQGARTITNSIVVADNLSAGERIIGGATADFSVFTGDISLQTNVAFSAPAGGRVTCSGAITGTGDIIKDGAGEVVLTGGVSTTAGGFVIRQGRLDVASADLAGRPITWVVGETSGVLAISGDCSLATADVSLQTDGQLDREREYVLATCTSGTLSNKPDVKNIEDGWSVRIDTNRLVLFYPGAATVLLVK